VIVLLEKNTVLLLNQIRNIFALWVFGGGLYISKRVIFENQISYATSDNTISIGVVRVLPYLFLNLLRGKTRETSR
jgi:hypothetical protein